MARTPAQSPCPASPTLRIEADGTRGLPGPLFLKAVEPHVSVSPPRHLTALWRLLLLNRLRFKPSQARGRSDGNAVFPFECLAKSQLWYQLPGTIAPRRGRVAVKKDQRNPVELPGDDTPTVVLGEDYRARVTRYEHAAQRFEAATRALRLDPRASVRRAMNYVAGLSHRELPKAVEPTFLELLEHASKLNASTDETACKELRILCSQRLHAIARILQEHVQR